MGGDALWLPDDRDVFIDIVGACNLACPSCGQGNSPGSRRPMGAMELDLFDRILDKVEREAAGGERPRIFLFNWGEPLLHPRAAEFVRRVKARGLRCHLSSNLVRPRDLRGVVEAGPDWLRISVSGFTQPTYGRTHRGGDVEAVKSNMRLLRAIMDEVGSALAVEVNYHVYRHNAGLDYAGMRALACELRFGFTPVWAIPAPVEKVVGWLEHGVPPEDAPLVELLVVRPEEARAISLRNADVLPPGECAIQRSVLVNPDGSVDLCCATWDVGTVAASFLDAPAAEITRRKREHPMCGPCMRHGLHLTALYAGRGEWDERGLAILSAEQAGLEAEPGPKPAA